jgi:hypothetical protein
MFRRLPLCLFATLLAFSHSMTTRALDLPAGVKTLEVNGYDMAYVERGTGIR